MDFIKDILKGVVMGIANIIPGVSGGTMAVTMGIYDKMINAVNLLFKKFSYSVKVLLPLFIGMALGIIGLSFLIEYLLGEYPLQTNAAFIGLIIGGIPIILSKVKSQKPGVAAIVIFALFFALIVGLQLVSGGNDDATGITLTGIEIVKLFVVGVIASATMIIPGVSGSMVLMILGYYQPVLATINSTMTALKNLDIATVMYGVAILLPFGIGVIIGIFAIAKLIAYLFENFEKLTYYAILGLIGASPVAILMNTDMSAISPVGVIVAIVCCGAGFLCAHLLAGTNSDNSNIKQESDAIEE